MSFLAQTEYLYNWKWTGYNPIGVGWETCDPGHSFGPGIREFYTVHYVLSGTGTYIVKGKEYHPKAGDMFAHAPYETVYYEADAKNPWNYVWINFVINGDVPYMFEKPLVSAPELRPIFRGIQHYTDHNNTGRDYVANCLMNIANQLATHQSDSAKLVDEAIKYIQSHYSSETLSIAEVSENLHISRSHLATIFSLEKNLTPMEYLIRFRLEKAIEYMTIQKLSPSVAAYSVGYRNYSNFTKIFKKYYGISPRDYQKNSFRNGD